MNIEAISLIKQFLDFRTRIIQSLWMKDFEFVYDFDLIWNKLIYLHFLKLDFMLNNHLKYLF